MRGAGIVISVTTAPIVFLAIIVTRATPANPANPATRVDFAPIATRTTLPTIVMEQKKE